MANELTFDVSGEGLYKHPIGDDRCAECWTGFPRPCKCGGLIHADFGEETGDGYSLRKKCDRCGDNHEEAEGGKPDGD